MLKGRCQEGIWCITFRCCLLIAVFRVTFTACQVWIKRSSPLGSWSGCMTSYWHYWQFKFKPIEVAAWPPIGIIGSSSSSLLTCSALCCKVKKHLSIKMHPQPFRKYRALALHGLTQGLHIWPQCSTMFVNDRSQDNFNCTFQFVACDGTIAGVSFLLNYL